MFNSLSKNRWQVESGGDKVRIETRDKYSGDYALIALSPREALLFAQAIIDGAKFSAKGQVVLTIKKAKVPA